MNAMRGETDVIKSVSILLDLTRVLVEVDISLIWMGIIVLVRNVLLLYKVRWTRIPLINTLLPDIDECNEGIDRCEQNCHNSVGSYACSCNSGYHLDGNGVTCNGIFLSNNQVYLW